MGPNGPVLRDAAPEEATRPGSSQAATTSFHRTGAGRGRVGLMIYQAAGGTLVAGMAESPRNRQARDQEVLWFHLSPCGAASSTAQSLACCLQRRGASALTR